jgi:hypothetical protein
MRSEVMTDAVDAQASLEATLKDEIVRMYQDVADNPEAEFHFYHGREAAELFGYTQEWLDGAPPGAVASFGSSTWAAVPASTRSSHRGK